MKIDKDMILNLLRSRGEHDKAAQAEQELPDQVDQDEHAGLLAKFGISPKDLAGKLGGLGKIFGKEGGEQ
jgi:lipopolysaccharide biosynthesis regulator YciM